MCQGRWQERTKGKGLEARVYSTHSRMREGRARDSKRVRTSGSQDALELNSEEGRDHLSVTTTAV